MNDKLKLHLLVDGVHQIKYVDRCEQGCNLEFESGTAFLQAKLPENTWIMCCESCRHGNFCPLGDADNQVFCLFGVNPQDKSDVVGFLGEVVFLSELAMDLYSHTYVDYCDRYQPADENYYTYSNWLMDYTREKNKLAEQSLPHSQEESSNKDTPT